MGSTDIYIYIYIANLKKKRKQWSCLGSETVLGGKQKRRPTQLFLELLKFFPTEIPQSWWISDWEKSHKSQMKQTQALLHQDGKEPFPQLWPEIPVISQL